MNGTVALQQPAWKQAGWDMPPSGDSYGGAIACCVVYMVVGTSSITYAIVSGYQPAIEMGLSCIARGTAMALRAKGIADGGMNTASGIVSGFLLGSGFSMAVALLMIAVAGWFKNTIASANMRPSGRFWRFTTFALLIIVVLFGTGVGLAAVMEIYVNPTPEKVARGMTLRQVSVGGMFSITSLGLIMVCVASWMAHLRGGLTSNGKLAPHASILFAIPSLLLLEWSAAFRVAQTVQLPLATEETLFFTLQELPELLQAVLYLALPVARIHLSSDFSNWWLRIGSKRIRKAGAPPPSRPWSWCFDDPEPEPLPEDTKVELTDVESLVDASGSPLKPAPGGDAFNMRVSDGSSASGDAIPGVAVSALVTVRPRSRDSKDGRQAWPEGEARGSGTSVSTTPRADAPGRNPAGASQVELQEDKV